MNTFGTTTQQFPLYDPRSVVANRARFRRDTVPMLDRANSLYCPSGRWPTRGWLLLARADYDRIDRYSTALQLHLGDPRRTDNVAVLGSLSIVQAQCVTTGSAADPSALYLVEVTDGRGVLHNEWFQFPIATQYNIRAPAYPQTFHPASMDGGTTWTWATMLQDMWERMGALLGAWPGLPYAPAGTPEGFWFTGVPAWPALCDVLDHLGMTVACDLTQSAPFTIVSTGATDTAFAATTALYAARLEDDLEWVDVGAARVPATVVVLFRRRNSVYGTEETVRYDAPQWITSAVYSVPVAAPAVFAGAVGQHHLWSDFTVRYDDSSNPLDADAMSARTTAAQRAEQYFARTYAQTLGRMSRAYAGALPFATGSQVDGVCWHHDYREGRRAGWGTRIVRGACPPFADVWGS